MEHTPYHMQHAVYHTAYKYTTRLPESGCVQVTVADYHQLLRFLRKQVGPDGAYVRPVPLDAHGHAADTAHAPAAGEAAAAGAAATAATPLPRVMNATPLPGAADDHDAAAWDSAAGPAAPTRSALRAKSDIDSDWRPGATSSPGDEFESAAAHPPPGVRVAFQ